MNYKFFKAGILFLSAIMFMAMDVPRNWFKAGDQQDRYEMGIDKGAGRGGKQVATIKSIVPHTEGFGTLLQQCLPGKFAGKKIKMTGWLKSKDVKDWAGFWLRIDQNNSQQPLSFDNMEDRPVKGTTDWKQYEIVLDVPSNASNIAYGALISGEGQIWFDHFSFEIVDRSVPATGPAKGAYSPLEEPTNLNFEE